MHNSIPTHQPSHFPDHYSLGAVKQFKHDTLDSAAGKLKDNYRGFHAAKKSTNNTANSHPPLQRPIKPNFKKKSSLLLNKLIHSARKEPLSGTEEPGQGQGQVLGPGLGPGVGLENFVSLPVAWNSHTLPQLLPMMRESSSKKSLGSTLPGPSSAINSSNNSIKDSSPKLSLSHFKSDIHRSGSYGGDQSELPTRGKAFNLELNLDEMQGIVRSKSEAEDETSRPDMFQEPYQLASVKDPVPPLAQKTTPGNATFSSAHSLGSTPLQSRLALALHAMVPGGWRAPDSWDVNEPVVEPEQSVDSRKKCKFDCSTEYTDGQNHDTDSDSDESKDSKPEVGEKVHVFNRTKVNAVRDAELPVLFGVNSRHWRRPEESAPQDNRNAIIRIFQTDGTFTTISCPVETTTLDMLTMVLKKFFFSLPSNYQLVLYMGRSCKVLDANEKPLRIQMDLLLLSGYTEKDDLFAMGREEISFISRFVVELILVRNLSHQEELKFAHNYVDVNLSNHDLKNIPILFHQHTYEIERLNVSDSPAIKLPEDFIQACKNLTRLNSSRNLSSKFPVTILEAPQLTHLNLEINFIHDIPPKISLLRCLTTLKLNSNQLSHLPKSFSKLKTLRSLNLSSNFFKTYPTAVNELTNLVDLDLSYNDLTELPDSLGQLVNLAKLDLCSNILCPSLPLSMKNLKSLRRINICYNELSNVDVLGDLDGLEMVFASKNKISRFSENMLNLRLVQGDKNPITHLELNESLQSLTLLDLSKAKITTIPPEFITKIPAVERLILDKNHLVDLPEEVGSLKKLEVLSLFGNTLQSLPATIGDLCALKTLDLHSNNLRSLPGTIWNLKSLVLLNVSSNILSAFPKPDELKAPKKDSSSSVNTVNAHAHPIDGIWGYTSESKLEAVDPYLALCDSLLILVLSDNRLSVDCFESISMLRSLKSLNLSYNDLLEIPEGSLLGLSRLTQLYLLGNQLTNLPADDLKTLRPLNLLYLNNNKLVSLPIELGELTNLEQLDVGSNQLKYNICNSRYDWNWHSNTNLRYLNFSGNKRFEIKQSHVTNPVTGHDFDSLLVLKNLNVLGLIDVTLTTTSVPDQSADMRIRTAASELSSLGYGVSESTGARNCVSYRDLFIQKFRGNENETLVCSFDGKWGAEKKGHRISALAKLLIVPIFTAELDKIKDESGITEAIRKTFLALNREINGTLAAKKSNSLASAHVIEEVNELDVLEDANAGCCVTMLYLKDEKLYTANIGDIEAILSRSNGDHVLLTTKHDPTLRIEFERIRAAGGYVSGGGALDNELLVSRGVGFFNFLPHTQSGPDIVSMPLTTADDMIVVATKTFWDYISYELTVDIMRQEKDDPMLAAQKLRDYAICYGAADKMAIIVLTLGEVKSRQGKLASNSLYHNLGRETDLYPRRRDRNAVTGDSALGRLEKEIDPPTGVLALIFTDIKNSTLLWDTYPVAMRSAIRIHNSIMRRQLRIVGGYEVKTEGDAFMVSFPSPTSALIWCFNVQHNLLTADWPTEILESHHCCEVTDSQGNVMYRGLSVRMGIHWGSPLCEPDVITGRMDYFGPMVNRASRISAVADGGQISVSSDFLDEITALNTIHAAIKEGKASVSEAYQGNVRAGEIIERELTSLEDIGSCYMPLGERKLKGLETPEPITLVYSTRLKYRFELANAKKPEDRLGKIFDSLTVEAIYNLRSLSLRLENLCAAIGMASHKEMVVEKQIYESTTFAKHMHDQDLAGLLNHLVTRVESCVTVLFLRQQMSVIRGTGGYIQLVNDAPVLVILLELAALVNFVRENSDKRRIELYDP